MTGEARDLLESALDLGADDRAALAAHLLASLESAPAESREFPAESAWVEEINRRARSILDGSTHALDWDDVRESSNNRTVR